MACISRSRAAIGVAREISKQERVNHCGLTPMLPLPIRRGHGYLYSAQPNDSWRCLRNMKARNRQPFRFGFYNLIERCGHNYLHSARPNQIGTACEISQQERVNHCGLTSIPQLPSRCGHGYMHFAAPNQIGAACEMAQRETTYPIAG